MRVLFIVLLFTKIASAQICTSKFLNAIQKIESQNGELQNHKLVTSGLHGGTSGVGLYGLMPVTIKWLAGYSKDHSISKLDTITISIVFAKDEKLQRIYAEKYLKFLTKTVGNNPSRVAYAWLNGPNRAPIDLETHYYVQRFNKSYTTQSFNCDS